MMPRRAAGSRASTRGHLLDKFLCRPEDKDAGVDTMNSLFLDIFLESFRAAVTGAIFLSWSILGKKYDLCRQPGWHYVNAGFGLFFFGTLIDITDNFPTLNAYLIVGDTVFESFLEKIVGYTLGCLLLAVGFRKWLPAIPALREATEKIKADERHFRSLIEGAFDIITVLDKKGIVLYQSPSLKRIFGYDPEELLGRDIFYFVHPEDAAATRGALQRALEQPGSYQHQELRFLHKDGTWRSIEAAGKYVDDPPGGRVIINSRDITERKRAEKAMKESAAKYRIVANNTSDWEFWLDPDGKFLYTSPSCHRITGHTVEEFIADPALLRLVVHPEDRGTFDDHRHGATQEKKTGALQFRVIRPDGTLRWVDHVCQPVLDEDGVFLGTRGSNRDVTDQKRMEEELFKARNLESLGLLAGGIAHDFNNLLQGILGNIGLAKMNIPATSRAFAYLENAEKMHTVARGLTNQFLAFAAGGVAVRETIRPDEFIRDAISFSLSGSNVKAVFDLPEDLPRLHVDTGQLHQVLRNIVLNARDAMPSGGLVLIKAETEDLEQGVGSHPLDPGTYVKISIKDQGIGIPKEHLSRIFDPYFSTKPRGQQKGLGLGLTVSDTIVRKHGGRIKVESESGRGATFQIYLPASVPTADAAAPAAAAGVRTERGARILIMDDEPEVLKVAGDLLELSGYRVDFSANGREAVRVYQEAMDAGDPYAVVLLDLTIPGGMGGKEAAALLRRIDPDVKTIVSSGYANDPILTDPAAYGFSAAIVKPYPIETLKETIDKLSAA